MKLYAALFPWVAASFLGGVALHSIFLAALFSPILLSALVGILIVFAFIARQDKRIWLTSLCLLFVFFGFWRFEAARLIMPRGLVPFSPNGLALSVPRTRTADPNNVRYWLERSRRYFSETSARIFSRDQSGLLTGILYGDRGLTKSVKADMRMAGLMHLVAVSGTNVTIVVVLLMRFFSLFRLPRRFAFGAVTIGIILFVLFVDPSASVVRAAIMGFLIECAPLVGRLVRPSRLLLISAVAFTLWQPWALLYDAGFALSFFAMWGLLIWAPYFELTIFARVPWVFVRQLLSASAGATIMTVPYSLWAFGQLTLWGLLTGLVAIPLVPWIMATGFLALLLPSVPFISLPAQGFLETLLWISRWPRTIGVGFWQKLSTPYWVMAGLYVSLFYFWSQHGRKKLVVHRGAAHVSEK